MAKRASKVLNVILNVLLVIALIITAYFIFYTFTHFTSNVQGPSMIPTFNNESGEEDRVLASKIASYTYGDIVILRVEEEGSQSAKDIIKRVYAFGGDSIDMVFENHNLTIYVNGNIVEEKQYESPIYYEEAPLAYVNFCVLKEHWEGEGGGTSAIVLPADTIFVIGDNREKSSDSTLNGPYDKSCVQAKVLTKIDKNSFAPFELIKYWL